jgi:hypothetical protein
MNKTFFLPVILLLAVSFVAASSQPTKMYCKDLWFNNGQKGSASICDGIDNVGTIGTGSIYNQNLNTTANVQFNKITMMYPGPNYVFTDSLQYNVYKASGGVCKNINYVDIYGDHTIMQSCMDGNAFFPYVVLPQETVFSGMGDGVKGFACIDEKGTLYKSGAPCA